MKLDKIELISAKILDEHPRLSSELVQMSRSLALSSGWHYILDWTWAVSNIGDVNGKTILDAGAGIGLMQWYFACKGADVISVDRSDRTCIPFHLISHFNVEGFNASDKPLSATEMLNLFNGKAAFPTRIKSFVRGVVGSIRYSSHPSVAGSVKLYKQDLGELTHILDNSVDLIVSISALEHNENIDNIKRIITELFRVLKEGGKMIVTLPASHKQDWFFKPALSWCLTDATIKEIFNLPASTPSNYDRYESIFEGIKNSAELKSNLSWRYYFSPNSGMPWGKWEPMYLPMGIIKTKQV